MDDKPVLWDRNSDAIRPLRTPNLRRESEQGSGSPNSEPSITREVEKLSIQPENVSNNKDFLIANSKLKADAPEFVPSYCIPNQNVHIVKTSVQNRLKKSKLPQESQTSINYVQGTSYNDETSPDFIRLRHIINTLIKDPGQFDSLLELFMETLFPYFDDIYARSFIAQLLVEQAINKSNFRYTGARLCWHIEQNCPEFRAELHLKCKKQLEDNPNKQNILLFVAELYTQLPHLNVYGALLIDSIKPLLMEGGNDNVKCVCQALKLTGYSLEQSNRNELNEVFKQLDSLKNKVNGSASALLNSVCTLRSSNWGRSTEISNEPSDQEFYEEVQSTSFYNMEGHPLTNEECEFLAANIDSNEDILLCDSSDPDELCDPEPEMDEEIQAAFKEFVKFSKH